MNIKVSIITAIIFIAFSIEVYFVFTNEVVFLIQFFIVMTIMVGMGLVLIFRSIYDFVKDIINL
jgi:hypothetical protein